MAMMMMVMMSSVINFLIMKTTINSLITMTMINSLSFVIWLWRLKRKLKRGRRNGSMRECHGILMSRSCVMRTLLKRLIECPFEPLRSWFTCWRVMSLGISPSAVQLLPFTQKLCWPLAFDGWLEAATLTFVMPMDVA